jgi:hypothetical protein
MPWTPEDQKTLDQLQARRAECFAPVLRLVRRMDPGADAESALRYTEDLVGNAYELVDALAPFLPPRSTPPMPTATVTAATPNPTATATAPDLWVLEVYGPPVTTYVVLPGDEDETDDIQTTTDLDMATRFTRDEALALHKKQEAKGDTRSLRAHPVSPGAQKLEATSDGIDVRIRELALEGVDTSRMPPFTAELAVAHRRC